MTGTFLRKSNGKNSFIPDDGGEPIFIAERNSAHAMNNDKVKIALCAKRGAMKWKVRSLKYWNMPMQTLWVH